MHPFLWFVRLKWEVWKENGSARLQHIEYTCVQDVVQDEKKEDELENKGTILSGFTPVLCCIH